MSVVDTLNKVASNMEHKNEMDMAMEIVRRSVNMT